jgi:ribosomal protein S18 acetylase RimI-like enzyme
MTIKIQKATNQDVSGIIEMIKQICDYQCELDKYYRPFLKYKNLEKEVLGSLKDKNTIVLLAKLDKKIIGYCVSGVEKAPSYAAVAQIGYIYTVIIDNKYRGKGIGKKILNELMKWFKIKKIKNIELEVDARNSIGVDFWKNNNFFTYRLKLRRDL